MWNVRANSNDVFLRTAFRDGATISHSIPSPLLPGFDVFFRVLVFQVVVNPEPAIDDLPEPALLELAGRPLHRRGQRRERDEPVGQMPLGVAQAPYPATEGPIRERQHLRVVHHAVV